jgi:hypothetical protein
MKFMFPAIAYADNSEISQGNFIFLLIFAGTAIAIFLLAGILIITSRRRDHRNADAILTCSIFWAILSLGSVLYAAVTQMKWSQEHLLELQSGYGNPADVGPALPWAIWAGLGVAYAALFAWSAIKQ